jgi:hypothetical protein
MKRILIAAALLAPLPAYAQLDPAQPLQAVAAPAGRASAPSVNLCAETCDGLAGLYRRPDGGLGLLGAGNETDIGVPSRSINPHAGLARTYFGAPAFPVPGGITQFNGKLVLHTSTRGWEIGSTGLSVQANGDPQAVAAGQGGFWDPAARPGYSGQDGSATSVWISSIPPIATVANVTFGALAVRDLTGKATTVYPVQLPVPLTSSQIARIRFPMRVDTNNKFSGYIIPEGLTDAGGHPLPPVSADGTRIIVDSWVRGAPYSKAGPHVLPSAYDKGPYSITIDTLHLVEDGYYGWQISASDTVTTAHGLEFVLVNNKNAPPIWSPTDALADEPLLDGTYMAAAGKTRAVGAGHIVGNGIKRAFEARNTPNPQTGDTYGFFNTSAVYGLYSVQHSGYLIGLYPGGGKAAKYAVDASGNSLQAGNLVVQGHMLTSGGAVPAIAAGFGRRPSLVGNDNAGRITVGAEGAMSGQIVFAKAWGNPPVCSVQDETTSTLIRPTPTATTLTFTGSMAAGDAVSYQCTGF